MDEIIVDSKTYARGLVGKIVYDNSPQPYDGDTVCQIAYLKRSSYTLGTEAVSKERMDEIAEGIKDGSLVGLPIYAYVHGGATIRAGEPFSCQWDSGMSGFAYCTKDVAITECGSVEKALGVIRGEVEIFDAYLTGDVFGYVLEDEDGDTLESCWGYYGSDEHEYMWSELDSQAAYHIKKIEEAEAAQVAANEAEAAESLYWAQRDVVTASVRY